MTTKPKEPTFTMSEEDAAGKSVLAGDASQPGTTIAPLPEMNYDQLMRDGRTSALQVTTQDMAIPFLRVLQSNSPQVDRDNPKYVKGSEAGMFINTVTNRLWNGRETGILTAVIAYQRSYTEWKPRADDAKSGGGAAAGSGFIKDWAQDDSNYKRAVRNERNKMITPDGTEMVLSGNYFVYVVDPETGAYEQVVLPLAGTQLKKSRRWNSLIKSEQLIHPVTKQPFSPPPFFRLYRLTTVPEQNDKGNWKGLKIEPAMTLFDLPSGGQVYSEAMAFKALIDEGKVKPVEPTEQEFGETGDVGGGKDTDDEGAPF